MKKIVQWDRVVEKKKEKQCPNLEIRPNKEPKLILKMTKYLIIYTKHKALWERIYLLCLQVRHGTDFLAKKKKAN